MSAVVPRIDVDLEDVECIVKITRPLVGVPDSVIWTELPSGVAKVSTDATLYIFDEDDDGKPERRVIARASAYTIDLARVGDVVDAFDQVGGEASEIAELILGSDNIFDMLDASDPLVGEQVSQLVIVEHVSVLEPYRGQRLGPRLLTTLVETVTGTGDGTLIVLRAQPVPWEHLSEIEFATLAKEDRYVVRECWIRALPRQHLLAAQCVHRDREPRGLSHVLAHRELAERPAQRLAHPCGRLLLRS